MIFNDKIVAQSVLKTMGLNENSIKDARTPQPGEIVFNTTRYISVTQYKDRDTFSTVSVI